ncbi:MAG: hypothetical protein QHJ82_16235 [Verrucomicrobiota bacterium]|nr:hypothetical protein [Verrucomicrobiota bacterium]
MTDLSVPAEQTTLALNASRAARLTIRLHDATTNPSAETGIRRQANGNDFLVNTVCVGAF